MTYDSNLAESEQIGLPEMYELTYGGETQRFTSWPEDVTFLGSIYISVPVKRSGFNIDTEYSSVSVQIAAPLLDAFVRYIANQPIEPTQVVIYRALATDLTDYVILFSGFVLSVSVKDQQTNARCESNTDILNFAYPRLMYQAYCNHEVFDGECGLDELTWEEDFAVTVSGSDLVAAGLAGHADGWWTNGRAIFGSDQRLITNHVTTTVTLQIAFDSRVSTGSTVTFLPGCDGAPLTCQNKFSNFDNFLGFPYIPSKNPVVWGIK